MLALNFWAVFASMILSVALGFIWYGPLFGKKWMELSGVSMPEGKQPASVMARPIILSLIGAFFMACVLSFSITFHNAYYLTTGIPTALSMAFLLWVGFIVPPYLNFTGWECKPWALFFINSGYWLVFLLISAAIFALLV